MAEVRNLTDDQINCLRELVKGASNSPLERAKLTDKKRRASNGNSNGNSNQTPQAKKLRNKSPKQSTADDDAEQEDEYEDIEGEDSDGGKESDNSEAKKKNSDANPSENEDDREDGDGDMRNQHDDADGQQDDVFDNDNFNDVADDAENQAEDVHAVNFGPVRVRSRFANLTSEVIASLGFNEPSTSDGRPENPHLRRRTLKQGKRSVVTSSGGPVKYCDLRHMMSLDSDDESVKSVPIDNSALDYNLDNFNAARASEGRKIRDSHMKKPVFFYKAEQQADENVHIPAHRAVLLRAIEDEAAPSPFDNGGAYGRSEQRGVKLMCRAFKFMDGLSKYDVSLCHLSPSVNISLSLSRISQNQLANSMKIWQSSSSKSTM